MYIYKCSHEIVYITFSFCGVSLKVHKEFCVLLFVRDGGLPMQLRLASDSWAQMILLPQPPE
jgi:hypothetical protein